MALEEWKLRLTSAKVEVELEAELGNRENRQKLYLGRNIDMEQPFLPWWDQSQIVLASVTSPHLCSSTYQTRKFFLLQINIES